ncbi:hypothetical protein JR338_08490 [Chloroflexota bacterium]|nr:hypothetical protein JR338_08490 [Chloroflexota bacterium]
MGEIQDQIDLDYDFVQLLFLLNGYPAPLSLELSDDSIFHNFPEEGMGFSQFNELQLLLGYKLVSRTFFQYLLDGTVEIKDEFFLSFSEFALAVTRFRKLALLSYGNIQNAFKIFSTDSDVLYDWLVITEPIDEEEFENRHEPINPVNPIDGRETYYLGHLTQNQLKQSLLDNPDDVEIQREYDYSQEIVQKGKRNYQAYLTSDHLDVYIATSMRLREEYFFINKWVKEIFNFGDIKRLKLRWFDPTQAFCESRIDKGLFEALMLKRAKCTLYFVQESDTLGKDSELASTLAQGKTVIAYVPRIDDDYMIEFLKNLGELYPRKTQEELVMDKIKEYKPQLAWEDEQVQAWVDNSNSVSLELAKRKLKEIIGEKYDARASLLSEKHPLGIQVFLERGVANGVLVVRDLKSCAKIIKAVITKNLEFKLVTHNESVDQQDLYLIETTSNCIYRLATGDQLLTNTFWNYYITPRE